MTGYVIQKDHYCCDQKRALPALVFVREHPPGYIPCKFVKLPEKVAGVFEYDEGDVFDSIHRPITKPIHSVVCHRDTGEVLDVIRKGR
jgi:hypothetical protein